MQLKEAEELKSRIEAIELELAVARKERDEVTSLNWMFQTFIGNHGEVVNKARLYDEGMGQQRVSSGPKVIRCLVDYNTKIEMLLKEMRALFQQVGQ